MKELNEIRNNLIDYLEQSTFIDWRYYETIISPGEEAKGGVKIYSITRAPVLAESLQVVDYNQFEITLQTRIIFAHESAEQVELGLIYWADQLDMCMQVLSTDARTLPDVDERLLGIKLGSRGIQFSSEEISGVSSTGYRSWKGVVLGEYNFTFDKYYF